jgi:hypothetical protein
MCRTGEGKMDALGEGKSSTKVLFCSQTCNSNLAGASYVRGMGGNKNWSKNTRFFRALHYA